VRSDSEKRRHPRSDGSKGQAKLLVDGSEVTLVDISSSGLRIELTRALELGTSVKASGEIEGSAGRISISGSCQVQWCADAGRGLFHAGLSFERASDIPRAPVELLGNGVDYYEVLQVSRRADADTIRRVYHLMAQRYHPDNAETGNDELFRHLVKANEVLSDPARRAAFDLQLASHDQARLHLFENWQGTQGVQAEVIKRQAILRLLYNQRFTDSERPWIVLRDFGSQCLGFVLSTAQESGCAQVIIEEISDGLAVRWVQSHCLLKHLPGLRREPRCRKRVGGLRAPSVGPP